MALSPRQRRFYTDVAALWRPVATPDSSGLVTGDQWGEVGTNIPCHFEIRPNVDENSGPIGRLAAENLFVLDVLYLDEKQEIGPDYVVQNLTRDPDGSPSENYGLYWRVRGPARNISRRGNRRAERRQVYIFLLREAPVDIPDLS